MEIIRRLVIGVEVHVRREELVEHRVIVHECLRW
jgi:hypothetical protein